MRLFVGIAIPPDVAASVGRFVARVRDWAPLRFTAIDDMHVTTKFIGEVADDRVGEIETALAAITRPPFEVAVRGLGWFPDAGAPRVFWAGVDAPELAALAADTERALVPLGVDTETRAYTPHLTLARIDRKAKLDALRAEIARTPSPDFGAFRADGFALYETRSGHHVRRTFPLVAG